MAVVTKAVADSDVSVGVWHWLSLIVWIETTAPRDANQRRFRDHERSGIRRLKERRFHHSPGEEGACRAPQDHATVPYCGPLQACRPFGSALQFAERFHKGGATCTRSQPEWATTESKPWSLRLRRRQCVA